MNRVVQTLFATLLTLGSNACSQLSSHRTCGQCGTELTSKRCQVITETKMVPKDTYSVNTGEICLPEHGFCQGRNSSVENCTGDGSQLLAQSASIYQTTTLVKKTEEKPETKYKWVVVNECPRCLANGAAHSEACTQ
ncbi:hypothetical protein SH668x_001527 [Planctomicrobium sp. SH668]|uniref:hypothetical protein n=1 Tax=Planctomicrobium sp. SH668 TaxID=3448126 RepID=UPI003F5C153B